MRAEARGYIDYGVKRSVSSCLLEEEREEEKGEDGLERDGVERNVSLCLQGEEREMGKGEEGLEGEEERTFREGVGGEEERQVVGEMTISSRR